MDNQKEKGLKQKLLLGGLVLVLSLTVLTTCVIVMMRANDELAQAPDESEILDEDTEQSEPDEDDTQDSLDEEDSSDDMQESQTDSSVQAPSSTPEKQYKRESYVWLLNEERLEHRDGDIFIYVESPENIDNALMLRIVGEDLYIVSRNDMSIIGNNNWRVATVSEYFIENFLADLRRLALTSGRSGYWYFYDSEEDASGELGRSQQQRLWEYCITLQSHAQGKITREEYDEIIEDIMSGA